MRSLDLALVLILVFLEGLPPHFAKCGGWLGCGWDAEFSFLRE